MLYTAHYDHLSVDPRMDGHDIYNGAVDNATGCGVLFELVSAIMVADDQNTATHDFVRGSYRGGARVAWLAISGETLARDASQNLFGYELPCAGANRRPEEIEAWGAKRTTFYSSVEGTARTFGLTIRSPGSRVLYGSELSTWRGGDPLFFDFRRFEVQRAL